MSIDASAVARVVGIETKFKDLRAGAVQSLPQCIAILAQGASAVDYPLTLYPLASAQQAARFGFGSPISAAARELFPVTGGGVESIPVFVLPLEDAAGAVAAVGTITPSGAATTVATYWVRAGGVRSAPFTTAVGDSVATLCDKMVAAATAALDLPLIAADGATKVDLTAKWKGASGNDITLEVLDSTGEAPTSGLTFTIVQPTGGATDPDAAAIAAALALIGTKWVTKVINGLGPSNTAALDKINEVGEGRWGQLVRKPFVAYTGNPEADVATATTVTAARATDRINVQLSAPGSVHMPVTIAAAQVREIAKVANNNPPTDYGGRAVRNLIAGPDGAQWNFAQRNQAIQAGSSTTEVTDGIVRVSDVVTMYRPTGEVPPAYRHVVDIVKLMTIIYQADLEFTKAEWNGAPLIADGQPTTNPNARKPSAAKAAWCSILDALALEAIIIDAATAKKNTVAWIDAQNPKRLNLSTTVQLSGNTNIISVDLNFGFYFGQPALVG